MTLLSLGGGLWIILILLLALNYYLWRRTIKAYQSGSTSGSGITIFETGWIWAALLATGTLAWFLIDTLVWEK